MFSPSNNYIPPSLRACQMQQQRINSRRFINLDQIPIVENYIEQK